MNQKLTISISLFVLFAGLVMAETVTVTQSVNVTCTNGMCLALSNATPTIFDGLNGSALITLPFAFNQSVVNNITYIQNCTAIPAPVVNCTTVNITNTHETLNIDELSDKLFADLETHVLEQCAKSCKTSDDHEDAVTNDLTRCTTDLESSKVDCTKDVAAKETYCSQQLNLSEMTCQTVKVQLEAEIEKRDNALWPWIFFTCIAWLMLFGAAFVLHRAGRLQRANSGYASAPKVR